MWNLYGSTHEEGVRKYWRPANVLASPGEGGIIARRKTGAFVRRSRNAESYLIGPGRDLVVGHWVLTPTEN